MGSPIADRRIVFFVFVFCCLLQAVLPHVRGPDFFRYTTGYRNGELLVERLRVVGRGRQLQSGSS